MQSRNDGFYHAWAYALCDGVGKDSDVMGVSKDSRHGALLSLISFHGMTCMIP